MRLIAPTSLSLAVLLSFVSCATAPTILSLANVNRAEGVVELSARVGGLRSLVVDWDGSQLVAQRACNNWGYRGGSAF